MTTTTTLLTAEQFRLLPDDGKTRELVRGRVIEVSLPSPRHGYYCGNVAGILREHVKSRKLGRVVTNDAGIITERKPDTVRGGDVSYYSFLRLPPGPLPEGYLEVVPEIVFEVRSPSDGWTKITAKATEYLVAGVLVVCVLDPKKESVTVYRDDESPQALRREDELTFPDLLPEFRVKVGEFFD
jgi:Uma2 family endonuclease